MHVQIDHPCMDNAELNWTKRKGCVQSLECQLSSMRHTPASSDGSCAAYDATTARMLYSSLGWRSVREIANRTFLFYIMKL